MRSWLSLTGFEPREFLRLMNRLVNLHYQLYIKQVGICREPQSV